MEFYVAVRSNQVDRYAPSDMDGSLKCRAERKV